MTRTLLPARGPLMGRLSLPGDKSISHRAFIFASLASGGLRLANVPASEDVAATRACLTALGVPMRGGGREFLVGGGGPLLLPRSPLDCANSGTTMRLLAGVLAGQPGESELTGDASLSRRPMERVAAPLRAMGAGVRLSATGTAPVNIEGRRPLRGGSHHLEVPSAQVKSAILLAGLFADSPTSLTGRLDTRDHTERMLRWLTRGRALEREGSRLVLTPMPLVGGGRLVRLPGDPSSAAFLLAAAVLVPGSDVLLEGLALNPSRTAFTRKMREMGAAILPTATGEEAGEPVGSLAARHQESPLAPLQIAATEVPHLIDEVPILALLATQAEGSSRLCGLGELRHKESDRLAATCANLVAMGASARVAGDDLLIDGPTPLRGAALTTHGDHRLALTAAVASLIATGSTTLDDDACIAISYPGFFEDLGSLQTLAEHPSRDWRLL